MREPVLPHPMPTVSVIIPTYNTAAYIGDALDSVFAQTRTDYEVIVVNDGSPDTERLEQVLAPYRERITYIKQENRGPSGARNAAIRAARAPLLALLDSDDLWEPHYLAVQMTALERDPTIDVIYPNALIFGDAPEAGRMFMEVCPSDGDVTFEALATARCTVMVSVLMRREVIFRAGLFDESFRGPEDFDLWLRVLKHGGRISYHRQVLVRYRRREGCLMSNMIPMHKEQLKVFEKARRTLDLTSSEAEIIQQQHARIQALLCMEEGKRAFLDGNTALAVSKLGEANAFFKSRRMTFVLILLRIAPRLLLRVYSLRHRLVFGPTTMLSMCIFPFIAWSR